jgi:hypothetical protein
MMQKKKYHKQVEALVGLMLNARTVPQVHVNQAQAEALSRAILAEDALVPRELIIGLAKTYKNMLDKKLIKADPVMEELIKYAKN